MLINRVACAGAGYFSQFHYDAWSRIPEVQVVGSMDRSIALAKKTGYPAFDHLPDMLNEVQPQLLDIITPPDTHYAFIHAAVEAGLDAIICQKPFCTSLAEATQATQLCKTAGIPLIIHENFRFQPWYRSIRQALDDGLIGTVHQMTFRLRTGDGQGKNAYLDRQPYFQTMPRLLVHETGVHWIDTFRYMLGKPLSVYADLRTMNPVIAGEDAAYIVFEFEDNKRALFDGNRSLDHAATNHRTTLGECLVEGTAGTLTVSGDGSVHHRRFAETHWHTLLPASDWPGFGGDCVYALQSHVLTALSSGEIPENTAEEYLEVLEVEAAIYQSSADQAKVILSS